jgi:hypothetical protein
MVFTDHAQTLINESGFVGYILPNKFLTTQYGKSLRHLISKRRILKRLINFTYGQVFVGATTYTCLLFLMNKKHDYAYYAEINKPKLIRTNKIEWAKVTLDSLSDEPWKFLSPFVQDMMNRLSHISDPLKDVSSRIFQGIRTSANHVYILHDIKRGNDSIEGYSKALDKRVTIEAEICVPFLEGEEIQRYEIIPSQRVVIIPYKLGNNNAELITLEELQREFPYTYNYLKTNKKALEKREDEKLSDTDKWHGFVYPKNLEVIQKPKILTRDIIEKSNFALDDEGNTAFVSGYGITIEPEFGYSTKYILAILNSNLGNFLLKQLNTYIRGGYVRVFTHFLEPIPIRRLGINPSRNTRKKILEETKLLFNNYLNQTISKKEVEELINFDYSSQKNYAFIHDLLDFLVEKMIKYHIDQNFIGSAIDTLKYIDKDRNFIPLTEVFSDPIKYGERLTDLGAVHHDIDGLRLVPWEDGGWQLEAELKLRDPEQEWQEWQYEEGGNYIKRKWTPVYRFRKMDEDKARYYQFALPVRDEFTNAGSLPGGYTRTTQKKLELAEIPGYDPDLDLTPLVELTEELEEVERRIALTDELIDQIVYKLYGLTEEEIAIVEGKV